jgi:hypothetical protein
LLEPYASPGVIHTLNFHLPPFPLPFLPSTQSYPNTLLAESAGQHADLPELHKLPYHGALWHPSGAKGRPQSSSHQWGKHSRRGHVCQVRAISQGLVWNLRQNNYCICRNLIRSCHTKVRVKKSSHLE